MIFYENNLTVCADAKPHFETLSHKLKGVYKSGAVDCRRTHEAIRFCRLLGVKSVELPLYGVVINGKTTFYRPETKSEDGIPMSDVEDFADAQLPYEMVKEVTNLSYIKTILKTAQRERKIGAVMVFNDSDRTSPLYAILANRFRNDFKFGIDNKQNESMKKAFNIKKYPMVVAYIPKPDNIKEYDTIVVDQPHKRDLGIWLEALAAKHEGSRPPEPANSRKNRNKRTLKAY